ncbi:MAG: ATP-binding protein [Gammaproteobacteria bacterium]|nr:ATP-binding protein [Gammaproteobacteria bacterium]NNF48841.1 ATP-binding protein [Woeseiaceae bacterium]MBT8093797.1 ATP-binding protein [Gammaproteobacteria bacterium]MBT8105881.1 ATP-binding protein [Gammaproteobacteria bacterium]NNK25895.1 ATP-binding protein [Woeseiaceae bacterium]
MDHLARIARSGAPETGVLFRGHAYGDEGVREFLRDVMSLANAEVEGRRYIVVGVDFDDKGRKQTNTVDTADFTGTPSYQTLANEYIEPAIRLRYQPVSVDGTRIGIFEIGDCQDRPYMMRVDYSEGLRRGDAYKRVKNSAIKMGRRQLLELFERKFRDSVSASDIEIGFPGEIIHKKLSLPTCDLSQMPSALASRKLEEMLRLSTEAGKTGTPTIVARLTHARLYGAQEPFVDRSPEQILQELEQIRTRYRDQDSRFLFNERAERLQLVAYYQGNEAITGASLSIVMPNHDAFHIAEAPPRRFVNDRFIDALPEEVADYPAVTLQDTSVKIMTKIGDITPGEPRELFRAPLLACFGSELKGMRFGVRYRLDAQNLRQPATGRLKIEFA